MRLCPDARLLTCNHIEALQGGTSEATQSVNGPSALFFKGTAADRAAVWDSRATRRPPTRPGLRDQTPDRHALERCRVAQARRPSQSTGFLTVFSQAQRPTGLLGGTRGPRADLRRPSVCEIRPPTGAPWSSPLRAHAKGGTGAQAEPEPPRKLHARARPDRRDEAGAFPPRLEPLGGRETR